MKRKRTGGRKSKCTEDRIQKIVEAIRAGLHYELAAKAGGISKGTLYLWLREGKKRSTGNQAKLARLVEEAEVETAANLFASIMEHSSKDWKASAWALERRFGWTKGNTLNQIPEEETSSEIPTNLRELLEVQLEQSIEAMRKAQLSESWQAYAALQRQVVSLATEIKALREEDGSSELDEMNDEQILEMIEASILSLPPVLRQRTIERIVR